MKKKKAQKNIPKPVKEVYHGVVYPRTDGMKDGKKSLEKKIRS